MRLCQLWPAYAAVCGLFLSGCSGVKGPNLAPVTGVVLLDGQPLADAKITFQPSGDDASPSIAETSADGRFKLKFSRDRDGAMIGTHQVRITTAKVVTDPSGKETEIVEKLSARYNTQSELKYEVKPGKNEFEIKLESTGGPPPGSAPNKPRPSC